MELRQIQQDCLEGRLSVREAVEAIDAAIGGITRVDFKKNHKFKVTNHQAVYALDVAGFKRRELDRLDGMAAVAYVKAQRNGSLQPGEVHISAQASTKHHRGGIYKLVEKYAA